MVDGAKKWGVGEKMPIDLPGAAASSFGEVADFDRYLPLLAIGGFGQGRRPMVPLHMAMVASTIANGGEMMKPYVVAADPRPQRRRPDAHHASGVEDADLAARRPTR